MTVIITQDHSVVIFFPPLFNFALKIAPGYCLNPVLPPTLLFQPTLIRQLIDQHVQIAVRTNTLPVAPNDPRISHKTMNLQVARVVVVNRILCGYAHVYKSISIAFEAIGLAAAVSKIRDIVRGLLLSEWGVVVCDEKRCSGDTVKCLAIKWAVVYVIPVWGDLNAVEAFWLMGERHSRNSIVPRVALVGGEIIVDL